MRESGETKRRTFEIKLQNGGTKAIGFDLNSCDVCPSLVFTPISDSFDSKLIVHGSRSLSSSPLLQREWHSFYTLDTKERPAQHVPFASIPWTGLEHWSDDAGPSFESHC
jgi:hypothetical protein